MRLAAKTVRRGPVFKATREGLADALLELGARDPDVWVMDADLAKSTGTIKFAAAYPDRFVECGVAEQSMMDTAAGLAASGKTVYTGSFAVFATGRAWEAVRNTIAYSRLNVKICPTHAGVTVGEDGGSHQTTEDIALMRVIPGMRVLVPADYYEAKAAVLAVSEIEGPVYIRLGRPPVPAIFDESYRFELGRAVKLREGSSVTLAACGHLVAEALQAAESLEEEGISAEVLNVSTIKPLDEETILASVSRTGRIVTLEEHSVIGGLGSAVAELLGERNPAPLARVGVRDVFGQSGSPGELLRHYGLDAPAIVEAAKSLAASTR